MTNQYSPGDPHAEYRRQAAQHFAEQSWTPPRQPPRIARSSDPQWSASTTNFAQPQADSAPTEQMHQPPQPSYGVTNPYPPMPYPAPVSAAARIPASSTPVAIALSVVIVVLALRWLYLSPMANLVLMLLAAAAVIGYYAYRQQNLDGARQLEAKVIGVLEPAARQLVTGYQRVHASAAQAFASRGSAPAPYSPPASPPVAAGRIGTTSRPDNGVADALISAVLIVPSLIAYGIVHSYHSFDNLWQPWAILMGLNAYFVLCVLARSLGPRRGIATLMALVAGAASAFVTSPSPDWGLSAIVQRTLTSPSSSYSDIQTAMTWSARLPLLTTILFVVAWGLARRRAAAWLVGLLPAAGVMGLAVWYFETEWNGSLGWFGLWLLNVGVFVAGCVMCWIADVIATPSTSPYPVGPYRY